MIDQRGGAGDRCDSGIGRAVAVHLATKGFRVFGTVRRARVGQQAPRAGRHAHVAVEVVELDVADDESVKTGVGEVLDSAGRVDVLVNNAGIGPSGVVEETPSARFLEVMNVNLCGAVRCTQAVLPSMRARRAGSIVNVTSVVGPVRCAGSGAVRRIEMGARGRKRRARPRTGAIWHPGGDHRTGSDQVGHLRQERRYAQRLGRVRRPLPQDAPDVRDGHPSRHRSVRGGRVIHHAITTESQSSATPCRGVATDSSTVGRGLSDEDWVAMGAAVDDADYYRRFEAAFGLAIAPP